MTDTEILAAVGAGQMTPEQAVRELVALGAAEDDARFMVAVETGQSNGDVIEE